MPPDDFLALQIYHAPNTNPILTTSLLNIFPPGQMNLEPCKSSSHSHRVVDKFSRFSALPLNPPASPTGALKLVFPGLPLEDSTPLILNVYYGQSPPGNARRGWMQPSHPGGLLIMRWDGSKTGSLLLVTQQHLKTWVSRLQSHQGWGWCSQLPWMLSWQRWALAISHPSYIPALAMSLACWWKNQQSSSQRVWTCCSAEPWILIHMLRAWASVLPPIHFRPLMSWLILSEQGSWS